jgi:hypothetical protein
MKDILKHSIINALGTALYIAIVVLFIFSLDNTGIVDGKKETIFTPIIMLMLFVTSAAFTGFLVFGKPIMWYLEGKKKEAIILLFSTLTILLMMILVAFLVLINIVN